MISGGLGFITAIIGITICLYMTKDELARRLAKNSRMTTAAAADQLDRVVSEMLKRVRKGQSASLPGLGTFRLGSNEAVHFFGTKTGKK